MNKKLLELLTDEEIDSMDLASGQDGSHIAYNVLKGLSSKKIPQLLALFPEEQQAREAYDFISRFASVNGSSEVAELSLKFLLKYGHDEETMEEFFKKDIDPTSAEDMINDLKQYLGK